MSVDSATDGASSDDSSVMSASAAACAAVAISIPGGSSAAATTTSVDDTPTVVYDDTSQAASTAVQPIEDGLSIMTDIASAAAPRTYSYDLSLPKGCTIASDGSGGYAIYDAQGDEAASIMAPWAQDANGDAVPTHYTLNGDTLTQTIDLTSSTAFPVVVDPSLKSLEHDFSHIVSGTVTDLGRLTAKAGHTTGAMFSWLGQSSRQAARYLLKPASLELIAGVGCTFIASPAAGYWCFAATVVAYGDAVYQNRKARCAVAEDLTDGLFMVGSSAVVVGASAARLLGEGGHVMANFGRAMAVGDSITTSGLSAAIRHANGVCDG